MRVHLVGESEALLLLGGMLAATGNDVTARSSVPSLRIALPGGWVSTRLDEAADERAAGSELTLVDEGEAPGGGTAAAGPARRVVVSSGADTLWAPLEEADACVALFDVLTDSQACLELIELSEALVVGRRTPLARLVAPLRRYGFRVDEAQAVSGHRAALTVARLLDLPVSLCNATREVFLSSSDGRRIAEVVLDEGLRVAEKAGMSLEHLSWNDPRELAQDLSKRPSAFDAFRHAPGRRYPPALQAMLRGGEARFPAHRSLVRRATELGLRADWTWRLLGLLPRVKRAGFFATPADLLRAVG